MLTVYLCGPINGCTDDECTNWRELVKDNTFASSCADHIRCLDPMVRDYRGVEDSAYREIVDLDKRDVREADIILVNYDKPSVGTSMEVFYAWTLGKPVVVVCRRGENLSPWLKYHSTKIVHSFESALEWIRPLAYMGYPDVG